MSAWLTAGLVLLALGALGLLGTRPAAASFQRQARQALIVQAQAGADQARHSVRADDPDAEPAAVKPADAGKKPEKKAEKKPPPELPNIAHVIHTLAPKSTVGKIAHNMHIVRPFFAFLMVLIFLLVMSRVYARRTLQPGRLQMAMEIAVETLDNLFSGILGPEVGRKYLPYLGSLFVYILSLNLFGLFPLALSPTAFYATTGALALCTLVVTQYTSFRLNGLKGVFLHWCGNPKDVITWVIGIIFIPLHIFSDLVVKPLSLLLRLWGNIMGEDVLLGSMLILGVGILSFLPEAGVPVGFPLHLPFMFLATLTSTIQALVFTLLSTIYILMVLPHEEHEEGHEEAHAQA